MSAEPLLTSFTSSRDWISSVTTNGPKKRAPGQSNAQHDSPEVDPNMQFFDAGLSGGLGSGTTGVGGYQPLLVRILRALARRREQRRDA